MSNTLFILSFLVLFGSIYGLPQRSSSSSINADAKEVAELMEKTHTFIPKKEKNEKTQLCQVVKQCCPVKAYTTVFSPTNSNISSDPIKQLGTICLNLSVSRDIIKKCPSILKLNASSSSSSTPENKPSMTIDAELIQLSLKVQEYDSTMQDFFKRLPATCNANETYAMTCMTNKKLLQSCIAKVFQAKLNSGDKKAYQTYTNNIKGGFKAMNRLMEKTG